MFSQTAEYALRAMTCLALGEEGRMSSAALAEQTQVPPDYLAKVLQQLSKAGLITGRRGVGGGYQLSRAASTIRLIDVVHAVEPVERIKTCPLGIAIHGANLCPLHRVMDKATKAVIDILDDIKLSDLINEPGASVPLCSSETRDVRAGLTVRGG